MAAICCKNYCYSLNLFAGFIFLMQFLWAGRMELFSRRLIKIWILRVSYYLFSRDHFLCLLCGVVWVSKCLRPEQRTSSECICFAAWAQGAIRSSRAVVTTCLTFYSSSEFLVSKLCIFKGNVYCKCIWGNIKLYYIKKHCCQSRSLKNERARARI